MNAEKIYNREESRKYLTNAGIVFESFNKDLHWKIGSIDFFPTTLKWIDNDNDIKGIGWHILVEHIKKKESVRNYEPSNELSVEQMFNIAKKVKPMNLETVCKKLHEAIYKGEKHESI